MLLEWEHALLFKKEGLSFVFVVVVCKTKQTKQTQTGRAKVVPVLLGAEGKQFEFPDSKSSTSPFAGEKAKVPGWLAGTAGFSFLFSF